MYYNLNYCVFLWIVVSIFKVVSPWFVVVVSKIKPTTNSSVGPGLC